MKRLSEKTAVVVGGTEGVGEGIVKTLLKEGAVVILPVRSQENVHRLVEYVPDVMEDRLITVEVDLADDRGYQTLLETVNWRFPKLDIVVAAVGEGSQETPLQYLPLKDWQQAVSNNLNAHFLTARTFLPHLSGQAEGLYVMIVGEAADMTALHSGTTSVMAAAQRKMAEVYATENADNPVRIHSLVLTTPVITRNHPAGNPDWITAEQAGDYITRLFLGTTNGLDQVAHHLPHPKS